MIPTSCPQVAEKVAQAIARGAGIEPASVNNGVVPAGDALDDARRSGCCSDGRESPRPRSRRSSIDYLHGSVVTNYLGAVQPVGVRLWLDPPSDKIYQIN